MATRLPRRCELWSPAAPGSSARTSSTRWSRAATRSSSSTTSRPASARTSSRGARCRRRRWSRATSRDDDRGRRRVRACRARGRLPPRRADRRPPLGRGPASTTSGSTSAGRCSCSRPRGSPASARFVFASTGGAIYGEGEGRDLPLAEDAECRPDAPYGQSKLAAEGYLGLYRRLYGLDAAALRLGNVYGPRQDPRLRGRRGRDLLRRADRRADADRVRRRRADARLRLRRRRRCRVRRRRRRPSDRRRSTSAPGVETSVLELGRQARPRPAGRRSSPSSRRRASARSSGSSIDPALAGERARLAPRA